MFNNNILVNAAINGFVKGALSGRPVGQGIPPTALEFQPIYLAAVSYATSLDALIAFDSSISSAGGLTLGAAAPAQVANQYAKVLAVESLSAAIFDGRYVGDVVGDTTAETQSPGFYASQAATVFAQYTEAVAIFTTTTMTLA